MPSACLGWLRRKGRISIIILKSLDYNFLEHREGTANKSFTLRSFQEFCAKRNNWTCCPYAKANYYCNQENNCIFTTDQRNQFIRTEGAGFPVLVFILLLRTKKEKDIVLVLFWWWTTSVRHLSCHFFPKKKEERSLGSERQAVAQSQAEPQELSRALSTPQTRGKPKSAHCPFSAPWKAGIVLHSCTPGGEDLTLLTVPYCEISLS